MYTYTHAYILPFQLDLKFSTENSAHPVFSTHNMCSYNKLQRETKGGKGGGGKLSYYKNVI